MNVKVKFIRRIRGVPRRSDRNIMLRAVLTAAAVQLMFWGAFSYRRPEPAVRSHGSSLSLLNRSDLTPEMRRWLDNHDPANMIRSDFRGGYAAQIPADSPRSAAPAPRHAVPRPEPAPKIGAFRELSAPPVKPTVRIPGLGTPAGADSGVASPALFADERGVALPLDGVKLPPRSAAVRGDTVLRVLRIGTLPTLIVEVSCGDPDLDRAAAGIPVMRLAELDPPPRYIVVRWPKGPEKKGKRP